MTEFLSDHLKALRDGMKRHAHGGKRFSSDEIVGLVERLDELADLARLQENQLSRHEWNEAARREAMIAEAGNVFVLARPRPAAPRHPGGGGNAA